MPPPLPAGIIRPLVDWLPQSATWVAVVAGPMVLLGYVVGSVPFARLLAGRRARRGEGDQRIDEPDIVIGAVLAGLATAAVATAAWDVALAATPGSDYFSAVGTYANQVIGAWVSVALWTGMAAVVGHMGSIFQRFQGGTGLPPAVALGFLYAPLVFWACTTTFLAASWLAGDVRRGVLAAAPVAVVVEYGLWLTDVQEGWGVTNGPELALWVTVLSAALFARNLPHRDGPARDQGER